MIQKGRMVILNEDEALEIIEKLSNGIRLAKKRIVSYCVVSLPCILNDAKENKDYASELSFTIDRDLK